jgi:propionyl-CoA synthetase
MTSGQDTQYAAWRTDSDAYWQHAAKAIHWQVAPSRIRNLVNGLSNWFPDGRMNTCYNAVDRHVAAGRGDQAALIYDSPMTGTARTYSYAQLQSEVAQLAGLIRSQGVRSGDRVIIYMPMVPQAVFAMLACARLGAVHSVVFGGFASQELAKRVDDAKPVLVLTASCGLEPGRVVSYKPLLDHARSLRLTCRQGATSTGPRLSFTRRRRIACRWRRPIRFMSSTRRGRRACRKGWCAITAVTPWR